MKLKLLLLFSLFCFQRLLAQSISGTILDEKNEPLIGAVVQLLDTKYGATTDADGRFRIANIPAGKYKVKVSFTGLITPVKEVQVDATDVSIGVVNMKEDLKQLDEFVKVGYGVQRRRDLTGSVAKISGRELNDLPVQSFEQGMQGKLPGVVVTQGSGLAGSASIIRIRGISSIAASGDPLYIVDGIPISQDYSLFGNNGGFNVNPLASLNPDDIESVEVLKDAAATSIYGSRGANGVVMITTKRAQSGSKLRVTYTGQVGISTPTATQKLLSTDEFLQLYQEAWINDGQVGKPNLNYYMKDGQRIATGIPESITWDNARKYNTNWLDQATQNGVKQQHNLTLAKGWKKVSLMNSFSYNKNETFIKGNSYERISERLNMDYQVTKKLKIMANASFSRGVNSRVYSGWSGGYGLGLSSALPFYPVKNPDGSYFLFNNSDGTFKTNPVMMQDLMYWKTIEHRLLGGISASYQISKSFTANIQGNYDYQDVTDDQYRPTELNRNINPSSPASTSNRDANYTNNYNYTATLNYHRDIKTDHHIDVMGGYERQHSITNGLTLAADSTNGPFTSNKETQSAIYGSEAAKTYKNPTEWIFERYFGRINYNYKGKYFAGLTASYDGSSKFGADNRYGFFPAISGGWILSEEKFLNSNRYISFLKLRSSYGKSGNSGFDPNARFGFFQYDPGKPYNGQPILYPTQLENKHLKWETTWTFDVGIDFGFLNDRISGSLEYYDKQTSDVIMALQIDPSNGFSSYYDNVGSISNRGIEFSIKTRNIDHKRFKWTTDFNIARNWNELTGTGNYTEDAVSGGTNDTRAVVGSPVGTFYLVRFSHVDKETGKPVYLDKNGKETFTWDPANRVPVGSILPKATGGITNTFMIGNFDISTLFTYQIGGNIYDGSAKRQLGVLSFWNVRPEIANRWQQPGDNATFPKLTLDASTYGLPDYWQYNTQMWLYDASYIRLRNLTVGYNVPQKWVKKARMERARVAVIITNVFVLTKYPGLDPEIARDGEGNINQSRNLQAQNVYYLNPPQERTYNVQVSVTF